MTIAEKLTKIAENEQKVYDAGYAKGYEEGYAKGLRDATLSEFTINGTAYQFEKGMTWEEWVNSEYNTINAKILDSGGVSVGEYGWIYYEYSPSYTLAMSTDVIEEGHDYYKT